MCFVMKQSANLIGDVYPYQFLIQLFSQKSNIIIEYLFKNVAFLNDSWLSYFVELHFIYKWKHLFTPTTLKSSTNKMRLLTIICKVFIWPVLQHCPIMFLWHYTLISEYTCYFLTCFFSFVFTEAQVLDHHFLWFTVAFQKPSY